MILNKVRQIIHKIYLFFIYGRTGVKFDYVCGDCLIEIIKLKMDSMIYQLSDKQYAKKQIQSIRVCQKLCNRILNRKYNIVDYDSIENIDKEIRYLNRDIEILYKIIAKNYNYW